MIEHRAGNTASARVFPVRISAPGRSHLLLAMSVLALVSACTEKPREQAAPEKARNEIRIVPQVNPIQPRRAVFAPDKEDRLLLLEASGLVGIWDLRDPAQPVRTAWIPAGAVDACFSSDGTEIVTAGWDGKVQWWSLGGELLRTSKGRHKGWARSLAVGPWRSKAAATRIDDVISGGEDGALMIWSRDGTPRGQPIAAHESFVVSIAMRANGDFVSAGSDESIKLWEKSPGSPSGYRPRVLLEQEPAKRKNVTHSLKTDLNMGWDHALSFSPTTGALAAANYDGGVRLFRAGVWDEPKTVYEPRRYNVRALAWTPKGDSFAAGRFDGKVALYTADGEGRGFIASHTAAVLSVAWSPSGARFVTTANDNRTRLWKADGTLVAELPMGSAFKTVTATVADDGPRFASSDVSGRVTRWKIDGSAPADETTNVDRGAMALAYSANGESLLAGGTHGTVALFGPQGAKTLPHTLRTYVDDVAFSPRGDLVALAGGAGRVQLLNSDGSKRTEPFTACKSAIHGLGFPPAGDALAVLCYDGPTKLWTLEGEPKQPLFPPEQGPARGLAFSAAGDVVAAGRDDGELGLWQLAGNRPAETIHVGLDIHQVGFHPHGLWVTANNDSVFFFDSAHQPAAAAVIVPGGVVAFDANGWFAGSRGAERLVRAFRADGTALSAAETAERLAPAKIAAILQGPPAAVAAAAAPASPPPQVADGASAGSVPAPTPDAKALIAAARTSNASELKRLLDGGPDPNASLPSGLTPLIAACAAGQLESVKTLLAAHADPNASDNNGATPLIRAAGEGHTAIVTELLAAGADAKANTSKGWNALLEASFNGKTEAVEQLLARGAQVDCRDAGGATPLHRAAGNGHLETMKLLLAKGADVNLADERGVTPLMLAAFGGHTDALRVLLERGGKVDTRAKDGSNALAAAAANGHVDTVEALLVAGVPVDSLGADGATPLMLAAADGHVDTMRLLLDRGAKVDARDDSESTALLVAAQHGALEPVKLLLERGADVMAMNDDGETAIKLAKEWSEDDQTEALLRAALDRKKAQEKK